jgi:hypothetical protein
MRKLALDDITQLVLGQTRRRSDGPVNHMRERGRENHFVLRSEVRLRKRRTYRGVK